MSRTRVISRGHLRWNFFSKDYELPSSLAAGDTLRSITAGFVLQEGCNTFWSPQQVHVKYHTLLWTALLSHGDVERALWETSQAHSEQLHQDYEADTRNRRTCHDLVQGKCYSWRITLILNSFWSQNHHSHWITIYTSQLASSRWFYQGIKSPD